MFETDGDRGEGACWWCKNRRYVKTGAQGKLEGYSKEPKAGYTDKKGIKNAGCRHRDGPNH